ncbi:hypothetical protein NDU88_002776 [Pleurodeles waltl]|uniref:Uncharacterized protein n=1 Tax=Pleurodeles waltl TaxID=8319 RepID=A0AAV7SE78_PLEWA|nr:hypothetical protein NDU88_002776 [Pleurodeles waltl]
MAATASTGGRGARPRSTLLFLSTECDARRFLATVVGVWGVWEARMVPKLNRTPRSLRARQNQDPGGTRKDKKLPVPGLKEHSNPHVKGGLHKTTDMEKDARYSVPTMFTSMMRLKQRSTEKAACDSQSNVPGVDDEQDIGVRIATMETRSEELEVEVKAATAQTTTQGQQISDIQWKLEDAKTASGGIT